MRREGFWKSTSEPDLPMPMPGMIDDHQAATIFSDIKRAESLASRVQYKGMSFSRIDDSVVGSGEFSLDGWTWPEGFAEHYVLKHKVKPSVQFLGFLWSLTDND